MSDAVMSVEEVTIRFGGVTALDGVSFDVARGRLTAVIGPNGAGKTSLFNCMSGVYRPTSGHIHFADADLTKVAPHKIARLALEFCDHAYVLENGRVVLEGPAAQLRADPQVQELYLGGAPGESERSFSKAKRYGRRARWLT